jgi:hypothetical protein
MVPVARLTSIKAQEGERIHDILVKGIVVAVDMVANLVMVPMQQAVLAARETLERYGLPCLRTENQAAHA